VLDLRKRKNKSSSRRQIDIKGVKNDILMLSKNQYRLALEVSPINFALKSDKEQDALIDTYEAFLNSLPCSIQILVRIRELDMTNYLANIEGRITTEKEDIYKEQLKDQADFVKSLVAKNRILSRRFYVILPYSSKNNDDIQAAQEQLALNAEIVGRGLARLGVQTRQLPNLEILSLFQSFYNPEEAKTRPLSEHVVRLINNSYVRRGQDD
jgi:hypothetical protein